MSDTTSDERSIETVIESLRRYDAAYYNGTALISDSEYDTLRSNARQAAPNHPYWNTVGAESAGHLDKVALTIHMGSQNKAHTEEDIGKWAVGVAAPGDELLMMDKADGSSVELTYVRGTLFKAVTRGDGEIGSLITNNARLWNNIPHIIKAMGTVVVRGEAILTKTAWKSNPCFSDSANPRNAGNGTVMRKSGENNQHIKFLAFNYEILGNEGVPVAPTGKLSDKLEHLEDLGFETIGYKIARDWKHLLELRNEWVAKRDSLDYEIDGIVVSVNDVFTLAQLGFSDGGTRPKGQIAWKFEAEMAITKVRSFELSMGHTGALIPTMKVNPVQIGGVTISSVLVNNFSYIADLDINIGDVVEIERAGDVIPHVKRLVEKALRCPCCGFVGTASEQTFRHQASV